MVLGLTQRQCYLLTGKAMLPGGLGQRVGMESVPGDASSCASVSPLVKQGCDVQYNPRKGGGGTRLELVFLKAAPQSAFSRGRAVTKGHKELLAGSVGLAGSWAPLVESQPKMGMQPPVPQACTLAPLSIPWRREPFCEPSAPPSVPKFFPGFISAQRRLVWPRRVMAGAQGWDSRSIP